MDATDYMKHWSQRQVWTHYAWPKHQARFNILGELCIGPRAIDVGCCYGHSTEELAKRYRAEWAGLDFDAGAIMKAKELFPERAFYYAPDHHLFEVCGTWDSVICSEVLEHIADDSHFVSALKSIVGSRLIISTPSQRVSDPGHLRVYTRASLQELFKDWKETALFIDGPYFFGVFEP